MGFANRWYRPGFDAAVTAALAPGLHLRHLSAPYFLATKFEAFRDRGQGDVYLSHDLEDIVTVLDGRSEVQAELAAAPIDVRFYVASQLRSLLLHPEFLNALPGIVEQAMRAGVVLRRIQNLAALAAD